MFALYAARTLVYFKMKWVMSMAREILSERPRRAGWVAQTGGAMGHAHCYGRFSPILTYSEFTNTTG